MPVRKLSRKSSKKNMKSMKHKKHTRKVHKHRGGSLASDRVMSFANGAGVQSDTPVAPRLAGNPANLNLYQTTGGARRRLKKSKSKSIVTFNITKGNCKENCLNNCKNILWQLKNELI